MRGNAKRSCVAITLIVGVLFGGTLPSAYASNYISDQKSESMPYEDVSKETPYYNEILALYSNGILKDRPLFEPDKIMTRSEFISLLWCSADSPLVSNSYSFTDIPPEAYYKDALSWAVQCQIIYGYDSVTFAPEDGITTEQALAILFRYLSQMHIDPGVNSDKIEQYSDKDSVTPWAIKSVQWACDTVILVEDEDEIYPLKELSRAEAVSLVCRYFAFYHDAL